MNVARGLTRFSITHPVLIGTGTAAVTVFFALGIPLLQRETSVRTFLGPEHETVVALDRHLEMFGGGYPVIIAYSCTETDLCNTVFDEAALRMAYEVSRELGRPFGIRAVHSPATTALMVPSEDLLSIRRFVGESGEVAPDRARLATLAADDPLWQRNIVSQKGAVGAIVLDLTSSTNEVQRSVASALDAALAPYIEEGWKYHLVGELVDFVYAGVEVEKDSQAMVPFMALVLCVVLFVLLRSIVLTLATVSGMGIAFVWTQGAMGWASVELNALTTVTPSLVFAIGILDGVHLVTQFSQRCFHRGEVSENVRREILLETADDIGMACLLTSLTTMGGFLAFLATGIASFVEFGLVAAWGILAALVLTFTLLPILLVKIPARFLAPGSHEAAWDHLLGALLEFVKRRKGLILAASLLACAICLFGVSRVRVEIDQDQLAGAMNRVTKWNHWVAENLRQTEGLEITLRLSPGVSYRDPEALDFVARISDWLDSDVERIGHPQSILGPLRRMNRVLHGGEPRHDRHEPTREGNAQLALLLSMNDRATLERWVAAAVPFENDGSGDVLRISTEAESMPTPDQAAVVSQIERYLDQNLPEGWGYDLTGSVPLYLVMMSAFQRNQILCFGVAGLAVFVLMALLMRSTRYSFLALVPSVVPGITTVGLLGLWGYGLNPASTMVATIILGVAVDDAIHLLICHQRERRRGLSNAHALDAAVLHVGRPVIVSSIVLAAAFWALTLSPSASVASFGFLAGVSIAVALLADLFILPSLLATNHVGSWVCAERAVSGGTP